MLLAVVPASLALTVSSPVSPGWSASSSLCVSRTAPVRMESLAQKMFGDVFGGIKNMLPKEEEPAPEIDEAAGADAMVADLDARAQQGEINFEDFLTMSRAFAAMDTGSGGMGAVLPGKLSDAEVTAAALLHLVLLPCPLLHRA